MSERWICSRCFTSAEEDLRSCPNCGTPRGMSKTFTVNDGPPSASQRPPAPPSGAPGAAPAAETPAGPTPAAPTPAAPTPPAAPTFAATSAAATGLSGDQRWVCTRCFASNDGAARACATCGLERGADPPPDAPGQFAAATTPAAAGSGGRQFPWRMILYGVIGLVVVGSTLFFAARRGDTGEITDAGNLSVQDLQVGDCFDLTSGDTTDGGEVSDVRAIPCAEPHVYEIYVVAEYPSGELPSDIDEDYTAWEQDQCVGGFDTYVGLSYEESTFWFSTLTPTDESWDQGDHAISCFLHNSSETPVTGSAEGTAQ